MLPKANIDNVFGATHDLSTSIQYCTNLLWTNMEDKFSRILIFQKFDKVVNRFPHLADQMFEELDCQSLIKLRSMNDYFGQLTDAIADQSIAPRRRSASPASGGCWRRPATRSCRSGPGSGRGACPHHHDHYYYYYHHHHYYYHHHQTID